MPKKQDAEADGATFIVVRKTFNKTGKTSYINLLESGFLFDLFRILDNMNISP